MSLPIDVTQGRKLVKRSHGEASESGTQYASRFTHDNSEEVSGSRFHV